MFPFGGTPAARSVVFALTTLALAALETIEHPLHAAAALAELLSPGIRLRLG